MFEQDGNCKYPSNSNHNWIPRGVSERLLVIAGINDDPWEAAQRTMDHMKTFCTPAKL